MLVSYKRLSSIFIVFIKIMNFEKGDFERYKYREDLETEVYENVVELIITREMWEEVRKQKEIKQHIVEIEYISSFKN